MNTKYQGLQRARAYGMPRTFARISETKVLCLPFLFIFLFSLLFFIKNRARMGNKYNKNFIEHLAYLHNQRQIKKCSSKLQCKFKLKLQQFNSL